MKQIYAILGTLFIVAMAIAASSFTTNYNLEKPADGDSNWGDAFRDNMDTIDSQMSINATSTSNHIVDTVDAHDATAISSDLGDNVCTTSDTVQEFLDCLDTNVNTLSGGGAVSITGVQTITGAKTFTATTTFSGAISSSNSISSSGAVTFSSLSTGVLHADSNGALTSSEIVNADVSSSADITRTKLAAGTANHVMINDGSGEVSSEAQLAASRGGTGQNFSASTGFIKVASGTFSAAANVSLTSDVSGVLPIANGGTGESSFTASRALVSDGSGGLDVSTTTATEIGYVNGVTSAIQTQLDAKRPNAPTLFGSTGTPRDVANTGITSSASHMSTSVMEQVCFVQGNGGAVDITSNPQIEAHTVVGAVMTLYGENDTNTLLLEDSNGLKLNGPALLMDNYVLRLMWNGSVWIETGRNF